MTLRTSLCSIACFASSTLLFAPPPPGKGPNKDGGGDDGGDSGSETTSPQDHKDSQLPSLIEMGTSGGLGADFANGYCCGGTLGALVTNGVETYILSNFHVLASDVVLGGNGKTSVSHPIIIHPALIDLGCIEANGTAVADFAHAALPLVGSQIDDNEHYDYGNVDAAIALVDEAVVDMTGSILGIGPISSSTVEASPRQRVKKSGRTTGFTTSRVSGVAATIRVAYEDECAGQPIGTATFTNQIVVENKGSRFLAGGDSGSLMVEDVAESPRAVGLLYAGSSRTAIANPIDDVLSIWNLSMVGTNAQSSSAQLDGETSNSPAGANMRSANAAQRRMSDRLLETRGVVGHGIGVGANGSSVIKVYVESAANYDRGGVPPFIDGIRVEVEETGKIVAF